MEQKELSFIADENFKMLFCYLAIFEDSLVISYKINKLLPYNQLIMLLYLHMNFFLTVLFIVAKM